MILTDTQRDILTAAAGRAEHLACPPRGLPMGARQSVAKALLRQEGTTIAQMMDATGWAQHTVRGFLAGLMKKGYAVEVLERVRQVGPNQSGSRGSCSIYRIAGVA